MPITTPDLDDRNYEQLYSEAMGVITRYFPQYAGLGPADPAMALVELFCYYFSGVSYDINRITAETYQNFAALLGIEKVYGQAPEEALRLALASLSTIGRAITAEDIVTVVKRASQDPLAGYSEPVARACVLYGEPVSVFVVQKGAATGEIKKGHQEDLRRLYKTLRACCPIGARFLLRHAPVLSFDVETEIVKRQDSTLPDSNLIKDVKEALTGFFNPLKGGDMGSGWEFGRAVSRSEIYGLIEGIAAVDHVSTLRIKQSSQYNYSDADELHPAPGGLVNLKQSSITIR